MSDYGDMCREMRHYKQEKNARQLTHHKERVIPQTIQQLQARGWTVIPHDLDSLFATSPKGRRHHYWSRKRWWQGPTQGYGLEAMIEAGEA